MNKTVEQYKEQVKQFYNWTENQYTFGTYWEDQDIHFTAGHVISESDGAVPTGIRWNWKINPGGMDFAYLEKRQVGKGTLQHYPALKPYENQMVIILGYPAGSQHLEMRKGWIHYEREPGLWIAGIKTPKWPVVKGMSGGMVLGLDRQTMTYKPIGVLVTLNSPADLDGDDKDDHSCDFVSIDYIKNMNNIA